MEKPRFSIKLVKTVKTQLYDLYKIQSRHWLRHFQEQPNTLIREVQQLVAVNAYARQVEADCETLREKHGLRELGGLENTANRLLEISSARLMACLELSETIAQFKTSSDKSKIDPAVAENSVWLLARDFAISSAHTRALADIESELAFILKSLPVIERFITHCCKNIKPASSMEPACRLYEGITLLLGCYTDRPPGWELRRVFGFYKDMPYASQAKDDAKTAFECALRFALADKGGISQDGRIVGLTIALALLVCPRKVRVYYDRLADLIQVRYEHWNDGRHLLAVIEGTSALHPRITASLATRGQEDETEQRIKLALYPLSDEAWDVLLELRALWRNADSRAAQAAILGLSLALLLGRDVQRHRLELKQQGSRRFAPRHSLIECSAFAIGLRLMNGHILYAHYPGLARPA